MVNRITFNSNIHLVALILNNYSEKLQFWTKYLAKSKEIQ